MALACALLAAHAHAAARLCTSADALLFGNLGVGSRATQTAGVSNCGDAGLVLTSVALHPATGPDWHVDAGCRSGEMLAPGEACAIDVTFAPQVTGQTSGGVWLHTTTDTPDRIVTFYGRGTDASAGSAAVEFSPPSLDFGSHPLDIQTGPLTLDAVNVGAAPLVPSALVVNGPAAYDYSASSNGNAADCAVGRAIAPGARCHLHFFFYPRQSGPRDANLVIDAPQLAALAIMGITGAGSDGATLPSVPVVEFHHEASGQYFLTADPAEIAFIDNGGLGAGWGRTGEAFNAWPRDASVPGSMPVCRFFGVPAVGPDSHFYTADPAECAHVKDDPHWRYEGIAWRALRPDTGVCASGQQPIVRLWLPGVSATATRHRYLGDAALVAPMQAAGFVPEGPVFCAPQ